MVSKGLRKYVFKIKNKISIAFFNKSLYDGKIHIYPTLRCNYDCPYCVDNYRKSDFDGYSFQLRSVEEWAGKINELGRDVVFTGGEPFLYKRDGLSLTDLVNRLDRDIDVSIYSNMGIDLSDQLRRLRRQVTILVSFHPFEAKLPIFLKNIDTLRTLPGIKFTIHVVDADDNMTHPNVGVLKDELGRRNVPVMVDADQDFEGSRRQFRLQAKCSRKIVLLGPDGTRYQCVGKLTRRADHLENVFQDGLGKDLSIVDCKEYGYCAACDWLGETKIDVIDRVSSVPRIRQHLGKARAIDEVNADREPSSRV